MKLSVLLPLLVLIACSGSGGATAPTLADMVGVKDATRQAGSLVDEAYIVTQPDGAYTIYDYLGDSFDNIANCYEVSTGTLVDNGGGRFTSIVTPTLMFTFTASFSGEDIILSDGTDSITYRSTSLMESDFAPICP